MRPEPRTRHGARGGGAGAAAVTTDGRTDDTRPSSLPANLHFMMVITLACEWAVYEPPTGPDVGSAAAQQPARSSCHPPLTTTGMFQTRTQKTRRNRYIMFTRNMKLSHYTTTYHLTEESDESHVTSRFGQSR